jgi:hypothetical protein
VPGGRRRRPFLPVFRDEELARDARNPGLDLRRWAAYTLGHESQMLPLWQELFRTQFRHGHWDTADGVPVTAYRLRTACDILAPGLAPHVYAELLTVLNSLEMFNDALAEGNSTRRTPRCDEGAPEVVADRLTVLVDRAVSGESPLAPWYN